MEANYDNFAKAFLEICEEKAEPKLRSMFKEFDREEVEPQLDFDSIAIFVEKWKTVFGNRKKAQIRDIKENWSDFAVPRRSRPLFATPNYYNVYHTHDTSNLPAQNVFTNEQEDKVKNAVEWINGERRMIYQDVFGVPCQCFEDMAPWEKERWIAFCIQLGYHSTKRIWKNFCLSQNTYFHQQPGLTIDKIWQVIGALSRGPIHDGVPFGDSDLKEPELLT